MATNQLSKLKEGVEAWNAWRKEKSNSYNIFLDLSEEDLSGEDLRGADLSETDLSGADLSGAVLSGVDLSGAVLSRAVLSGAVLRNADLFGADLSSAELSRADLRGAHLLGANLGGAGLDRVDLSRADLREAELSWADLSGAVLSGVDLSGAVLSGAVLREADFSQAILDLTVFVLTDLTTTKGLDNCIHANQCVIDYQTLQASKNLPLAFLRGCGLPDHYIDYLPSLISQPIQYYSCFISYSSKDDEFTQRLYADLQNNGVRCWYAPEDLKIGEKIRTRIDEVIRLHEKLLLVLSVNSIDSDWVEKEVETAFEKERKNKETVLFPIRLDDTVMDCNTGWAADIKRTRNIGDFREWKDHDNYKKAFDRLLRDLNAGNE